MSERIKWDQTGDRLYETGVKNGVLYPYDATNGYTPGVAWNGLTSVSESPSGAESTPLYADDMKYLNLRSTEEFGATVEAYTYPDEFAECDGSAAVVDGVMIGQQTRKQFGLCYRTTIGNDTEGNDKGYKLHLIYGATANPSEKQYQTINDSPEAITFSWEIETVPVEVGVINGVSYKNTASIVIDSTKVEAANLAALEDVLYGSALADARLPLPAEVINIMGGTSSYDIVLNRSNLSLTVGDTVELKATTTPSGKTVTWASSSSTYAEVADGVVTAKAAGTATITASFTENDTTYSDTCSVTVASASA